MLAAESYKHFRFVGVTRLELATSRPPDAYSNQLSYTPMVCWRNTLFHRCRFRGWALRLLAAGLFLKSDAKVDTFFNTCKFFRKKMLKKTFPGLPGWLFPRLFCPPLTPCLHLSGELWRLDGTMIITEYSADRRRYIKMQW